MRPSADASCLRTALEPRNIFPVDRKDFAGMLDASTRYSRSGSNGALDFHGDFTGGIVARFDRRRRSRPRQLGQVPNTVR